MTDILTHARTHMLAQSHLTVVVSLFRGLNTPYLELESYSFTVASIGIRIFLSGWVCTRKDTPLK